MKSGKKPEDATNPIVAEYRITEAAKDDLLLIAEYGDEHYGITQSNQYRDQLKQRILLLAEQPMLYPSVDYIRGGYRRSVCGAHSIYYRIDGGMVEIMRVLGRQDPARL